MITKLKLALSNWEPGKITSHFPPVAAFAEVVFFPDLSDVWMRPFCPPA